MDNMGPAYYEMSDLVTQDLEKAEVMNAFLPQSFLARPPPPPPGISSPRDQAEKLVQGRCNLGGTRSASKTLLPHSLSVSMYICIYALKNKVALELMHLKY